MMQSYARPIKVISMTGLAAAWLFTLGCGIINNNSTKPVPPATYAYILNQDFSTPEPSASVAQFQLANDGTLTPLSPATVAVDAAQQTLAVDPASQYFFSEGWNNRGEVTVDQFVIGSNGTITPNRIPSFSTSVDPGAFVFAPSGRVAVAVSGNSTVSSYSLDSSGGLKVINTVPAGIGATSAVIDATGQFVYVDAVTYGYGSIPQYTITEYTLSKEGVLSPVFTYSFDNALAPGALVVSPSGFLYLPEFGTTTDGGTPANIEFSINKSNGGLSIVNSFLISGEVVFNPGGTYAYTNNGSSISLLAVDPGTGALSSNGPDVSTNGEFSSAFMAIDPSGQFLFVENWGLPSGSPQVLEFLINSDGTLTLKGAVALGSNASPVAIAFAQR